MRVNRVFHRIFAFTRKLSAKGQEHRGENEPLLILLYTIGFCDYDDKKLGIDIHEELLYASRK